MHTQGFLCFVHPEKCGGSTVDWIMKRNFPHYYSLSPSNDKTFKGVVTAQQLAYMQANPLPIYGIGGHKVRSGVGYEQVVERPIKYFTILREPIARMLSHVNFRKQRGIQVEVDEYIEKPYHHNFMCYRLCGERSFEQAKKQMGRMACVLILEDFDTSLLMLNQAIAGGQMDLRYEVVNQGKGYGQRNQKTRFEDLSQELKAKINAHNAEDIRLYEYAREVLFARQKQTYPGDLEQDRKALQAACQHFSFKKGRFLWRKLRNGYMNRMVQAWAYRKARG